MPVFAKTAREFNVSVLRTETQLDRTVRWVEATSHQPILDLLEGKKELSAGT